MTEVSKSRVSKILDRAALGGSWRSIAKDIGETHSTVWNVVKEYPLWAYCHDKLTEKNK